MYILYTAITGLHHYTTKYALRIINIEDSVHRIHPRSTADGPMAVSSFHLNHTTRQESYN